MDLRSQESLQVQRLNLIFGWGLWRARDLDTALAGDPVPDSTVSGSVTL